MTNGFSRTTRLLVIDESRRHRAQLSRRLATRGHEIIAADSASALALIARHDFDLVLIDTTASGPAGLDVLAQIRADHSSGELPVVMVTPHRDNAEILRALELGANDYITSPIDFTIVSARIQIQLARRATQQALASSVRQLVAINRRLADEIAERKRTERRIRHIALHDGLTGLGNRVAFHAQLQHDLAHLPDGGCLAVFVLDLDGFKLTNDALGQRVGDALLATAGHRLLGYAGRNGAVMRVGSDEFAVIQTNIGTPDEAAQCADAIAKAIAAPCRIGEQEIVLDCSIGIALAPDHGATSDLLLSRAHLAMHRAKAEARAYRFFEADMDADARARRTIESDLRKALLAGQFEVYYQPLFNLATNSISGFEALLRWHHPERGMVSPDHFVPLAEEIGLIAPIGAWVLQQACREAARWPDDVKLAVNLSAAQFRDPDLVRTITTALAAANFPAHRLELEITETVVLDSNDDALDMLHQLRGLGIRISMDDFGTGYSSLSYLRKFPFDKIKIDRSFIQDLDQRQASSGRRDTQAIVRAVTGLATGMGMTTTAEGVETMAQMDWLRTEGCTEIQGYLMSRPIPVDDIDALLRMSDAARRVA